VGNRGGGGPGRQEAGTAGQVENPEEGSEPVDEAQLARAGLRGAFGISFDFRGEVEGVDLDERQRGVGGDEEQRSSVLYLDGPDIEDLRDGGVLEADCGRCDS
jgi:hypothetical protein